MTRPLRWVGIFMGAILCTGSWVQVARADVVDALSQDFWAWRAAEMPVSTDDIPRLERPTGWVPDWSATAVQSYRQQVARL